LGPYGDTYGTQGEGLISYIGTNATRSGFKKDSFYFGSNGTQNLAANTIVLKANAGYGATLPTTDVVAG